MDVGALSPYDRLALTGLVRERLLRGRRVESPDARGRPLRGGDA